MAKKVEKILIHGSKFFNLLNFVTRVKFGLSKRQIALCVMITNYAFGRKFVNSLNIFDTLLGKKLPIFFLFEDFYKFAVAFHNVI